MRIGVPKEIKAEEYRVGLTPAGVRELVADGHQLLVQRGAGEAIGLSDEAYSNAGAQLVDGPEAVYERAGLVIKVKEPQPSEYGLLREDQLLFTYLHLAPDPKQAEALLASGVTGIAYETVTDAQGELPLLAPMSQIAGRLAVQEGAHFLGKPYGGSGTLLGGVPGVDPGHVVVIGGGVVGLNAARIAVGLGARVTLLDLDLKRLEEIDNHYQGRVETLYSTREAIENLLPSADMVVGAVLVPGAAAPKLVTREMLGLLRSGSVLADVAIDQGGCFATSRATSHADPVYTVDGIQHYCVANIPGAVGRTATAALTHATLPYARRLAARGLDALAEDAGLGAGLNVYRGQITHAAVAEALNREAVAPSRALGSR